MQFHTDAYDRYTNLGKKNLVNIVAIYGQGRELFRPPTYMYHTQSDKHASILRKHASYLRLALALAPELVLELPELLEDELERDVDPDVELWDELDPLDDRELLSDELQNSNTKQTTFIKIKQLLYIVFWKLWSMAGNGLELYPVVGFCISNVELLGSAITLLVN